MTTIRFFLGASLTVLLGTLSFSTWGAKITLPVAGRVTIEYRSVSSAFNDTLWVSSPSGPIAVALSGCKVAPITGLRGVPLVTGNLSQPMCRVELDADPLTPGIQGFAANTELHFELCTQPPGFATCQDVWSNIPTENRDLQEHLQPIDPSNIVLRWEDLPRFAGQSDDDFNDLVVAVRVNMDADGDGIWDDWEQQQAIPSFGPNTAPIPLPAANPNHRDVYVRIDYMDCAIAGSDCPIGDTHSHKPLQAAIDAVVAGFANVPALNPDGTWLNPDHTPGINLHIEIGNAIAHQNFLNIPGLCFPSGLGIGNFDQVKALAQNFPPQKGWIFHYGLFSHQQAPGATSSGCAEMPGNDFQVALGGWNLDFPGDIDGDGINDENVGTAAQQAGALMHELGHNLGLRHGGDEDVNYKPNYLSVMNYAFQMIGIPMSPDPITFEDRFRMDYSKRALAPLDELNLKELPPLDLGGDSTVYFCPDLQGLNVYAGGFIDWNCDGRIDCRTDPITKQLVCTPIASDINLDGMCVGPGPDNVLKTLPLGDDRALLGLAITEGRNHVCETRAAVGDEQIAAVGQTHPVILHGYADWPNLKYDFQNTFNFADGQHTADGDPSELTYELYRQRAVTDLVVSQAASPTTVTAGTNITYTINLSNRGLPGAKNVTMSDLLPAATSFVSCSATGGGVCAGSGNNRSVTFSNIPGGSTASVTLVASASCAVANSTTIRNTASATTTVPERTLANNVADASVTVVKAVPTVSSISATPDVLWPANKKLIDVNIDYQVDGSCGPMSCVLSVKSNLDDDDDDDDHHCLEHHHHHCDHHEPNWIVVDAHHVKLRAEHAEHDKDGVYTITANCTNTAGATSSKSVKVKVPHKKPKH
jgi:uncharacterized repeat protein (TIGR01451 family)